MSLVIFFSFFSALEKFKVHNIVKYLPIMRAKKNRLCGGSSDYHFSCLTPAIDINRHEH